MAEQQKRAPEQDPERDMLTNHLDWYLGFDSEGPSIAVLFKCCRRAMIEVPLAMIASLPPERATQGVQGRVRCERCGKAARISIMPEAVEGEKR